VQKGFYFDQSRCIGCYSCVVACKDWHNIPAGPASWRRVRCIEEGKFPNLAVAFLSATCYHCAQPLCVQTCPRASITKRKEDGIVVVDRGLCLGKNECGLCKEACPYDAPQFGDEENATMQMCDFCLDRLKENKNPICVDACPMMALDAGVMDELKTKYGELKKATGFIHFEEVGPSIIFKPMSQGRVVIHEP
jgi:anaerobic dimethyl sulfoxide reductase subunit B (iron-sulfur subunit)